MIARLSLALCLLCLTACAAMVQQPIAPGPLFSGPRLEGDAFVSFDGARLGLSRWEAQGEPWAVVIGLHGMDDYANAFHLAGEQWAKDGITTLAYDQRGFGRSPGRGVWAGEDLIVHDLRTMTALARARYPHAIIAVAGVSMGGAATIAAFAGQAPPEADRVVLLSPAVWGWSTQPMVDNLALWLTYHTVPGLRLDPPDFIAGSHRPTDNLDELRAMSRDPLMLFGSRTDTLYGLVSLMQTAWRDIGQVKPPTLYLYGAHDAIIPRNAATTAVARIRPGARTAYYPDGYHLLLVDKQAPKVWADVEAFLRDPEAPLPSGAAPVPRR